MVIKWPCRVVMCACSEAWLPVLLMVGNVTGGGGAGPSGRRADSMAAYDNVRVTRQPLTRCRRPSVLQFGLRIAGPAQLVLNQNETKLRLNNLRPATRL
jgi:hypothetical protein